MNAAQIIGALAEHGARVAVDGERVKLFHPAGKLLPASLLDAARAHKAELRALTERQATTTLDISPTSGACPEPTPLGADVGLARGRCSEWTEIGAGVLADWLAGFASLDPNRPPACFTPTAWSGLIRDTKRFLATWGTQAADLGWTTLDLFGAHPRAPVVRYSCLGLLLLLQGGRVVALTTASAAIEQPSGSRLTYIRQPPETDCVPLWQLPAVEQS